MAHLGCGKGLGSALSCDGTDTRYRPQLPSVTGNLSFTTSTMQQALPPTCSETPQIQHQAPWSCSYQVSRLLHGGRRILTTTLQEGYDHLVSMVQETRARSYSMMHLSSPAGASLHWGLG